MDFGPIDYRNPIPPEAYRCSKCDAHGVKLWRQYQTMACNIELLCAHCGLEDQGKEGVFDSTGQRYDGLQLCDQIGWLVGAVPTEEGDTYWGYTSIPIEGVRWWRVLPTYPADKPCETCTHWVVNEAERQTSCALHKTKPREDCHVETDPPRERTELCNGCGRGLVYYIARCHLGYCKGCCRMDIDDHHAKERAARGVTDG